MDPSFSVLLGEDRKDECSSDDNKGLGGDSLNGALIGGIVGGVVGFIILLAVGIFVVYPRVKLWKQTKSAKKLSSINSDGDDKPQDDHEMVNIEKRNNMQVNTVAGNYEVRF